MKIHYPLELISSLKNKHLLLDTNIFRDAAGNSTVFAEFFNTLKKADITLATVDLVKYELLKGSATEEKYRQKELLITSIVDVILPLPLKTPDLTYELIRKYGIDGAAVGITDLSLGAMLMQYKRNICLLTRDTSDFMQNIFDLKFIINATH
jgi:predicted nucleic acid-binding protein